MSREVLEIDPDKLLSANRDYLDRIEQEGMQVVYDAALDTLFVEIGGPREALSEHAGDNVMVRIDPETLHIVGLEILDFFADFLPNNRLIQDFVREMGLQEGTDFHATHTEPRFKPLGETVEALIPQFAESVGAGIRQRDQ